MTTHTRPLRVLHLDDDADFVETVAMLLEMEHDALTVSTETHPVSALQRVEDEEFDCLVVDYRMPEMTGLEFLSALRRREEDVPFVLYSGEDPAEVKPHLHEVTDADVDGEFVQKGARMDEYAKLADRIEGLARGERTAP